MLPADCFISHLSDYSKYDISASELENRYLSLQMNWHLIPFLLICAVTFLGAQSNCRFFTVIAMIFLHEMTLPWVALHDLISLWVHPQITSFCLPEFTGVSRKCPTRAVDTSCLTSHYIAVRPFSTTVFLNNVFPDAANGAEHCRGSQPPNWAVELGAGA